MLWGLGLKFGDVWSTIYAEVVTQIIPWVPYSIFLFSILFIL